MIVTSLIPALSDFHKLDFLMVLSGLFYVLVLILLVVVQESKPRLPIPPAVQS